MLVGWVKRSWQRYSRPPRNGDISISSSSRTSGTNSAPGCVTPDSAPTACESSGGSITTDERKRKNPWFSDRVDADSDANVAVQGVRPPKSARWDAGEGSDGDARRMDVSPRQVCHV